MNINETIRNKGKILEKEGVYMQNYLHPSCLLSYTNSLGTNLMLILARLLNGPICKLSKKMYSRILIKILEMR